MNAQRKFLVLPSKKKPWYYVEKSKITLKFFVENLLTSRYKSLNAIIRFLNKIFLIDKLLLLFGHKTTEIENLIKPVFSSLKLTNHEVIIRRTTWQRENDKFTVFIFNGSSENPTSIAKCLSRQFSKSLETEFLGMRFSNPVGLAAGFDKNASVYREFHSFGFSFIEVGTITPLGQPGNEKPRSFRIKKDRGLINRMGFNNEGAEAAAARLAAKRPKGLIIGGNIGKNTLTPNEQAMNDYEAVSNLPERQRGQNVLDQADNQSGQQGL